MVTIGGAGADQVADGEHVVDAGHALVGRRRGRAAARAAAAGRAEQAGQRVGRRRRRRAGRTGRPRRSGPAGSTRPRWTVARSYAACAWARWAAPSAATASPTLASPRCTWAGSLRESAPPTRSALRAASSWASSAARSVVGDLVGGRAGGGEGVRGRRVEVCAATPSRSHLSTPPPNPLAAAAPPWRRRAACGPTGSR